MTYAYAFCLRGSEIISAIPPESDHSEVQYNKVDFVVFFGADDRKNELAKFKLYFRLRIC
jgi:hypothetical protein